MDRLRILFDHLQKTGGTSWSRFISINYPNLATSPLILHERVDFCRHLLDEYNLVSAHVDLIPEYMWPSDIIHVTMLRDPINRFLSHYSYVREREEATEPFARLAKNFSIDELIERNDFSFREMIQDFYLSHFGRGISSDTCSYSVTDVAHFISEKYAFIMLTENMDVFSRFFCDKYLLSTNAVVPVERKTQSRIRESELPVGTLKKLMQLTESDRELYWLVSRQAQNTLYKDASSNRYTSLYPITNALVAHSSLALDAPKIAEIRAIELSCRSVDLTDCAEQGSWCTLSLLIGFMSAFRNASVDIVIRNAVHAVAYRNSFPIDNSGMRDASEAELSWRFICTLGEGIYDCDFDVKFFGDDGHDYQEVHFRSAYQFSVLRRKDSTAAGSCYLVPQFSAAARLGPPELAGTIEVTEQHWVARPDELMLIPVTAVNRGRHPWPVSGVNRVNLSYWLQGPEIYQTHESAPRQPLTADVLDGSKIDVDLVIRAPKITGRYLINVGLVQERVAWLFLSTSPIVVDVVSDQTDPPPPPSRNPPPTGQSAKWVISTIPCWLLAI